MTFGLCTATPAGAVALQWYRQDGCWQTPSSWCCHGALPQSGQLGPDTLLALPKQQPCISCLYALMAPPVAAAAAAGSEMGQAAAAATTAAAGVAGAAGGAVHQSSEPLVLLGELVVSLERAKRVQLQVGALTAVGLQHDVMMVTL